jgi:hypothetical protein
MLRILLTLCILCSCKPSIDVVQWKLHPSTACKVPAVLVASVNLRKNLAMESSLQQTFSPVVKIYTTSEFQDPTTDLTNRTFGEWTIRGVDCIFIVSTDKYKIRREYTVNYGKLMPVEQEPIWKSSSFSDESISSLRIIYEVTMIQNNQVAWRGSFTITDKQTINVFSKALLKLLVKEGIIEIGV